MKLFRDTNNSETPFSVKSRHVMEGSYQDKKTDKTASTPLCFLTLQ